MDSRKSLFVQDVVGDATMNGVKYFVLSRLIKLNASVIVCPA